jgi:hypothetical protein
LQRPGVAIEVHTHLLQNSQAGRLKDKITILTPPTDSTLGGESLSSACKSALVKGAARYAKRLKQTSLMCTTKDGKITTMTADKMKRLYKSEIEAILYHHKTLARLFDPMVIVALTIWPPPMKSVLPQDTAKIYNNYVVPIVIATTSELVKYFGLLPEMATLLFDGVMVK